MTVALTETRLAEDTIYLEWSSDLGGTPDYYVYLDAILNRVTKAEFQTVTLEPGDSVQFEVLDSATQQPEPAFPSRLRIHWDRVTGSSRYHCYQKVSGSWVLRARQPEDGRAQYAWLTPVLADVTQHEFKIVAVSADGNEGYAREFSIFMVRRPDPPRFAYSYNAATDALTIT